MKIKKERNKKKDREGKKKKTKSERKKKPPVDFKHAKRVLLVFLCATGRVVWS